MRALVLTEQLGLYRNEELEGLKRRRVLIAFGTGRRSVGLNGRVVVGGSRRVLRAFQPRLRMPRQPAFGPAIRKTRKRLRGRHRLAMHDFVRTGMGLPDRRGIGLRREKEAGHGQGGRRCYLSY